MANWGVIRAFPFFPSLTPPLLSPPFSSSHLSQSAIQRHLSQESPIPSSSLIHPSNLPKLNKSSSLNRYVESKKEKIVRVSKYKRRRDAEKARRENGQTNEQQQQKKNTYDSKPKKGHENHASSTLRPGPSSSPSVVTFQYLFSFFFGSPQ